MEEVVHVLKSDPSVIMVLFFTQITFYVVLLRDKSPVFFRVYEQIHISNDSYVCGATSLTGAEPEAKGEGGAGEGAFLTANPRDKSPELILPS